MNIMNASYEQDLIRNQIQILKNELSIANI